jgi:chromosome partitioning protein
MLRLTPSQRPHTIVLGNLKGGSGKSTLSMHIAIGLMKAGRRVATIDLDFDQRSLTRYIENRQAFARDKELVLDIPEHRAFEKTQSNGSPNANEAERINFVSSSLAAVEPGNDFVIIDTPSGTNKVNLFAHALADTVITPINDSFIDLDVIVPLKDPKNNDPRSPYTQALHQAREARKLVTSRHLDWLVVRNRVSPLETRNERAIRDAVEAAGRQAGFRTARGLAERVIYREFFPKGLTAFDSIEASLLGVKPSLSHVLARQEVRQLISMVDIERGEKTDQWTTKPKTHIQTPAA